MSKTQQTGGDLERWRKKSIINKLPKTQTWFLVSVGSTFFLFKLSEKKGPSWMVEVAQVVVFSSVG